MSSTLLFVALIVANLVCFGVPHIFALRAVRPNRLLTFLHAVYFLAAGLTSLLAYLVVGQRFPSDIFYLAVLGAAGSGFTVASNYALLGPGTSDRSAWHRC